MGELRFVAILDIVGVNPFVFVPAEILQRVFVDAGKNSGPIPVRGTIGSSRFTQTLVRFQGEWRLYINMKMLKNSPKRIGESLDVCIEYDPEPRQVREPEEFRRALNACPSALEVFEALSPSRKNEIVRYLASIKSEETLAANIRRAIDFLLGKGRFVGRDGP